MSDVITFPTVATVDFSLAIDQLVPHTGQMRWLDKILDFTAESLSAEVVVRGAGVMGDNNGVPAWIGIEYMAQTIAAYSGVMAKIAGKPVQLGYLLGTRRYTANVAIFPAGARLTVAITKIFQDQDLGVFECRIQGAGVVATANLNVFQPSLDGVKQND